MIKLTFEEICKLTFNDCQVISFKINLRTKIFKFSTSSALFGDFPAAKFGRTEITISNWNESEICEEIGSDRAIIGNTDGYLYLKDTSIIGAELRDICVVSFGKDQVLEGFSKRGYWTKYCFYNSIITGETEGKD